MTQEVSSTDAMYFALREANPTLPSPERVASFTLHGDAGRPMYLDVTVYLTDRPDLTEVVKYRIVQVDEAPDVVFHMPSPDQLEALAKELMPRIARELHKAQRRGMPLPLGGV